MNTAVEEKISGKQMCELISEYFRECYGVEKTPDEIWNYSPTGELMMVSWWYEEAKMWKDLVTEDQATG